MNQPGKSIFFALPVDLGLAGSALALGFGGSTLLENSLSANQFNVHVQICMNLL